MTLNFPSPLAIKTFYTSRGREHVNTLYVRPVSGFDYSPGKDADQYEFQNGDGTTTADFGILCNVIVSGNGLSEMLPDTARGGLVRLLAETDSVQRCELWSFPPQSNDGTFLSAVAFDVGGDTTDTTTPAVGNQLTMTFRTDEGGILRWQVMETATENTVSRYTYNNAPNRLKIWINTLMDLNYPFIGKDGGRPIAFLRASMTQNERIYRKVYRP